MAVGNSLANRQEKTPLTAYLTNDAVKKQINNVVGGNKVYLQYCVSGADHAGPAGMYESQYPVSGPPGRGTEPFTVPPVRAVLHGPIQQQKQRM